MVLLQLVRVQFHLLTTYLEPPSFMMLASVTSNSRLPGALLAVGEGLTSPPPPRTAPQLSRAGVLGGPEGLASAQERGRLR